MAQEEGHFTRVLGNRDVIALAFGAMIGWGWVVLVGNWVVGAGSVGAMLAFAIGGTAVIFIGLTYAELAAAMPLTGGEHVYSYRALGVDASFICTWAIVLGYVSVVAFEAVALPTVLDHLIPGYQWGYLWTVAGWDVYFTWAMVGILGSVLMTWINIRGIQTAAVFQAAVTVVILIGGAFLMLGGVTLGDGANLQPLFVDGAKGVLAVLIMTPFMFVGFDVIPQAAEEINLPYKQIGKLLIFSVALAVFWYILIILACSLALDDPALQASGLATADAASALFGTPLAGKLIVLAGIGGIVTSWNAFYIGGSRAIYALAHARMLPAWLGKLHPKYNTPVNAILLIGVLSVAAPLFGRKAMVWLVDAGGLGIVIAYGMVAISFLILRKREPDMPRPFFVPKGRFVGWTAVILSGALCLLYLPPSPAALVWPEEWAIAGGWAAAGAVLYLWAKARHGAKESASIIDAELRAGHTDIDAAQAAAGTPAQ